MGLLFYLIACSISLIVDVPHLSALVLSENSANEMIESHVKVVVAYYVTESL